MLLIAWISYFFTGFVISSAARHARDARGARRLTARRCAAAKVPFPLTVRFKQLVQRDVGLETLDSSWVSSLSWYFLCMFGVQGLHTLLLGDDGAASQAEAMRQSVMLQQPGQDMNAKLKALHDDIALLDHRWDLMRAEQRFLRTAQAVLAV